MHIKDQNIFLLRDLY